MLQITATKVLIYFFIYSVVGWVCESIYCSIGQRKIINRGFLNGPYCPVYGFGALAILAVTTPILQYPVLVFLLTMLACGIVEYFTGWILEKAFKTRWWDYSNYKFNIKGRVCLLNLLLFGVMGVVVMYLVHPVFKGLIEQMNVQTTEIVAIVIIAIILIDTVYTVATITSLRDRLHNLQAVFAALDKYEKEYDWYSAKDMSGSIERLRKIVLEDKDNETAAEILARIDKISNDKGKGRRLLKAFPNANFRGLDSAAKSLRNKWLKAKERLKKD